jgi:hypothetical protein
MNEGEVREKSEGRELRWGKREPNRQPVKDRAAAFEPDQSRSGGKNRERELHSRRKEV